MNDMEARLETLEKIVIKGNGTPSLMVQTAEIATTLKGLRWLILAAFVAIPAIDVLFHGLVSLLK